jgi:hypothetical protein
MFSSCNGYFFLVVMVACCSMPDQAIVLDLCVVTCFGGQGKRVGERLGGGRSIVESGKGDITTKQTNYKSMGAPCTISS